jgi:hypothetical protein
VTGGARAPKALRLAALRRQIDADPERLRALLGARALRKTMGEPEGRTLARVPRDDPPDHPGADLLRRTELWFSALLPPRVTASPALVPEVARRFRLLAPLVRELDAWLSLGGQS